MQGPTARRGSQVAGQPRVPYHPCQSPACIVGGDETDMGMSFMLSLEIKYFPSEIFYLLRFILK